MKSKILFFTAFFSASFFISFAQITIQPSDLTVKGGDTLWAAFFTDVATLSKLPAVKAGANQTWDFSTLNYGTQRLGEPQLKPTNPEFSNATYQINTTAQLGPISFPVATFHQKNSSGIYQIGMTNESIKSSLQAITGSNKDTLYLPQMTQKINTLFFPLPMIYNQKSIEKRTWERPYALTVGAFGLNKVPGTVKTNIETQLNVDGWGSLTLMDNKNKGKKVTYAALQLRYSEVVKDSIFLGGKPAPLTLLQAFGLAQGNISNENLVFYVVPGFLRYALELDLDAATGKIIERVVSSAQAGFISGSVPVKDAAVQVTTNVFPNPSSTGRFILQLEKTTNKDWTIKTYDLSGRELNTAICAGEGTVQCDIQINTVKGVYFYALFNEHQQFVTNGILNFQ